jgi:hypothetical protein
MLLVICCCCIIVVGGGYYFLQQNDNTSTPASDNNKSAPASDNNKSAPTSDNNKSAPTSDNNKSAPTSDNNKSAPTSDNNKSAPSQASTTQSSTTPALPTYYTANNNYWWAGEGPDNYVCMGAKGRNVTGNGGDFNRYCIFNKEEDAIAYCNSDSSCKGFTKDNSTSNKFQLTRNAVVNRGMNSTYKIKLPPSSPSVSYMDGGSGWWPSEGAGAFTCPGATGRNTGGDYNNYCIFNNETDAKEYCSSDTSCQGVAKDNGRNIVQATRNIVPDPNVNSRYFMKLVKK